MEPKMTDLRSKKIVMLGFGSIGSAMIDLIFKNFNVLADQFHIISAQDTNGMHAARYPVFFEILNLTKDNLVQHLDDTFAGAESVLINVSTNVCSKSLINYCQSRNIVYIDSSFEIWDDTVGTDEMINTAQRFGEIQQIKAIQVEAATAITCHGANPGIVSHFAKQLILNLAQKELEDDWVQPTTRVQWAKLAQRLDIQTLIISEVDTQQMGNPNDARAPLFNTWSVTGLLEEAAELPCFPLGSAENLSVTDSSHIKSLSGLLYFEPSVIAANYHSIGYSPSYGCFEGMLIPHVETFSISNFFTDVETGYAPTSYFCYRPCLSGLSIIQAAKVQGWDAPNGAFVPCDELEDGIDSLGVLALRGGGKKSAWFGSEMSVQDARSFVHTNATSMQVVSGLIAALNYAVEHPKCGMLEPEDLDTTYVLRIATPYLGNLFFQYIDRPFQATSVAVPYHPVFDASDAVKALPNRITAGVPVSQAPKRRPTAS